MEDLFVWRLHKISIYFDHDILFVNPSMRYPFIMCSQEENQETESIDLVKIKEAMKLILLEEGINQAVIHEYLKHVGKECFDFGTQDERTVHLEIFSERLYFYKFWTSSKIKKIVLASKNEFPEEQSERKSTEDQFLIQLSRWWMEKGNCTNNMIIQENYELKISIEDGIGETYRRIIVPSNYTFSELSRIIIKIFGWSGSQHRFLIRKKNHSNIRTSNYYGIEIEAILLDGFDMLAEDYLHSLYDDHMVPHAFDTEVSLKDIFRRNRDSVHEQEPDLIFSYGSERLWVPCFYLHRIEFIHVVISNEKLPPMVLESSGLRPPEVLHGSLEYYKSHKFLCDESSISFHEGTDAYVEIMEPRRSLEEMQELLKTNDNSLGISYRGLIHKCGWQC